MKKFMDYAEAILNVTIGFANLVVGIVCVKAGVDETMEIIKAKKKEKEERRVVTE